MQRLIVSFEGKCLCPNVLMNHRILCCRECEAGAPALSNFLDQETWLQGQHASGHTDVLSFCCHIIICTDLGIACSLGP